MLLLAACATPEPRVSTITNTVSVPTPIPCLTADQIPQRPAPTPVDIDKATHDQIDAANVADLKALDQFAAVADPLLRQCAKAP